MHTYFIDFQLVIHILQHKNSTFAAQKRRRAVAAAWFVNENLTPQAARRRRPPCKYPNIPIPKSFVPFGLFQAPTPSTL